MIMIYTSCSIEVEDTFGPVVASSCLNGFDFTLLFEEYIFTLVPLCIVCLTAFLRIRKLQSASEKVNRSWSYAAKLLSWLFYIICQKVLLALWIRDNTPKTKATLTTVSMTIFTSWVLAYLSHLEHSRSIRPSTIINLFFGFSLLFDLIRLRTLYFMPGFQSVSIWFSISCVIKLTTLALEAREKQNLLNRKYSDSPIEATSGILNLAVFWWLNELLWRGSKGQLTVDNLPTLDDDITSASDPYIVFEKWSKANTYNSNALMWAMISHYKLDFLKGILPRLALTGFSFAQPFVVERVIDFMDEPDHVNSTNYAYGLIAAYAIVYLSIAISYAAYEHQTNRAITKIRGSLVSLIFYKTLRMNTLVISDSAASTLMSTDIERIASGLRQIHEVYASIIEAGLALWLLARLLNMAMIASTLFVILCLSAGVPLGVACADAQVVWLEAVEERVAVTAQVLGFMKNIKMTGLTETISTSLRNLQSAEIKASFPFRLYETIGITLSYASSTLGPIFGLGAYIIIARLQDSATLTSGVAFSALTLFSLLDQPLGVIISGVEEYMTVANCFQRIQGHLLERERIDYRLKHESQRSRSDSFVELESSTESWNTQPCVIIRSLSASWLIDDEPVLKDLNLDIPTSKITMIVGPVGSGKSSFLKLLLGEIPEISGTISTSFTHAAYCSQPPWVTFGTIQQNIIGGVSWDQSWYNQVIKICALQSDFQQLPAGDKTKVGVRGSRLSGGQQMRVALARALYSNNPVLILDDPLMSLDHETEKSILESVFAAQGIIKATGKTVIMTTNSAHHLGFADKVIILDDHGKVVEEDSYQHLMGTNSYISTISRSSQTLETTQTSDLLLNNETLLLGLNIEEKQTENFSPSSRDLTVYTFYFQNIGWALLTTFFICCAFFILSLSLPQIWLQWWTTADDRDSNQHAWFWLGIYAALGIFSLLMTFLGSWIILMVIQPRTSRRLHDILLRTTLSATTSFLTSTDIGDTTNRFSQDLERINTELPGTLEVTVNAVLSCIIEGFLVFFGSSYVTVTVIPFCALAVYYLAIFYLKTSRQMRLLDIEAKSPLFSHFLEAQDGISSIRAYGLVGDYQRRNRDVLDASQRPFYLLYCIQRWLTLVLDLMVAAIAVIVVSVALSMKGSPSMNWLGITLFNIVNFSSTLQSLVKNWIELETSIGAVARIRSYTQQVVTEDLNTEIEVIADNWPQRGCVEIFGLSASYESTSDPVLRDINLRINTGEKIALCGRTGSGKSSLISALLRILEPKSGTILIDDVDISKVSRAHVRSRINTLPQQPFFLRGSIRLNANPENNTTDETIITYLRLVNLWSGIEYKGGLDANWSDELFSYGQQQLFCLVRALCKQSNLLIMDEATSSVDSETDMLMQSVIRDHFKNQTIIAIVHKLHTILDFDKVAVMDSGRIVEFDTPGVLLSREGSAFKILYDSLHGED